MISFLARMATPRPIFAPAKGFRLRPIVALRSAKGFRLRLVAALRSANGFCLRPTVAFRSAKVRPVHSPKAKDMHRALEDWSDDEFVRRWGRLFPTRDKSRQPLAVSERWVN